MSNRVWNTGCPPHVGWWNASFAEADDVWRWWDGKEWSAAACSGFTAWAAAVSASQKLHRTRTGKIFWTDYWPKNARVPRINPEKP